MRRRISRDAAAALNQGYVNDPRAWQSLRSD
jgi:hypothetical protein